jgi:hypothetical protein
VVEVLRLRLAGESWPAIARRTRLGLGTVYRAYRQAVDALRPFQNPKAKNLADEANASKTVVRGRRDAVSQTKRGFGARVSALRGV